MTAAGIVMGDGSVLIRMSKGDARPPRLDLDVDRDRFGALMTVVGGWRLPPDAVRHIEAAEHHWRRGDKALANLRLIFAGCPQLSTQADCCRLMLAKHLLDHGMTPADLMAELGFSEAPADLEKYSRDQPRVPAGHGRESGEFGSSGASHAKAATDDPEVCPAPEKDRGHGAQPRSLDYEEDVHERVNPENPIRRGDAVRVWDPGDLQFIYVDDCFRKQGDLVDGDMKPGDLADTKGPGYDRVLSQTFGKDVMDGLVYDAGRQLRAADARGVRLKWYFAEQGAADLVRERFKQRDDLSRIVISHMPPWKGR